MAKRRASWRWPFRRFKPIDWIVLSAILTIVAGAVLWATRDDPRRIESDSLRCASNLKQIGLAIFFYARDNADQLPPDFEALLRTQDLTAEIFICPGSTDVRAPGESPYDAAAHLSTPGHCSYVYLGHGSFSAMPATAILVYELPSHHGRRDPGRRTVLFGDGHAEMLPGTEFENLIASATQPAHP